MFHRSRANNERCFLRWRSAAIAVLMMAVVPARAASVFFLDQSNALPDGTNYLSVMLTENGTGGVDFLVQTLDPLNDIAGRNFGIQKFGFSFLGETGGEITGLPDYWRVVEDRRMSSFGRFDIRLQGKGKARTDSLSFTVGGVTLDDFDSLMAAHVAGFQWCDLDEERQRNWCDGGRNCTTSAYFAGRLGDLPPDPIPAPAALWLFSSGLIGLIAVARRKMKADYSERP